MRLSHTTWGGILFSPPLAANTLTPGRDRACWGIAQHLKSALNADYKKIACRLENPVAGDEPVIVGIRDYNAWSNNFNDFPLLTVYRRGASGEYLDIVDATIAYYLPTLADQDDSPGILHWVESRIARALHDYDSQFFGGTIDTRHVNLLLGSLRSDYGLGVLPGTEASAFPFVRINFQFQEIGV